MADFSVHTRRDGDRQILTIAGEIDVAAVDEVVKLGHPALADGIRTLVLDLADVTFLDSAGIGALVSVRKVAHERGATVVLRRPTTAVLRVLTIAGVTRIFEVEAGPDAAP